MFPQKIGTEFLVNTTTPGDQEYPTVASLNGGGFVVTWQDGYDYSSAAIKAQLFDASGAKIGSEFVVNSNLVGGQWSPTVTGLTNGGFVITWEHSAELGGDGSGNSVKAQVFDATGAKLGNEFLVNTVTAYDQTDPQITHLGGGGFVITWRDLSVSQGDYTGGEIKAQVFDASGAKLGNEFLVNTTTAGQQFHAPITGLSSGGFVVTWTDGSGVGGDTSELSIKAQLFDAAGAKVGSEFLVNTVTEGSQNPATITALSSGGFVVSWTDYSGQGGDTSVTSIKTQVFDANGAKLGGEFSSTPRLRTIKLILALLA